MCKQILFLKTFKLLIIPSFFCKADSLYYYSFIDTIKLKQHVEKIYYKKTEQEKNLIYKLFKINYLYIRRNNYQIKKHIISIEKKISLLKETKFIENFYYYKLLLFTMTNTHDSINFWMNYILKKTNFSLDIKVRALNTVSYYYLRKNITKSVKILYQAIDLGLKDSIPELYHTFLNLSGIYLNFNLISKAEKFLELGEKFKEKNFNPILDNLYIHNKSLILLMKNQHKEAKIGFLKVYYFMKKYNILEYEFGALINIARTYYIMNNIDSSCIFATKTFSLVKEDTLKIIQKESIGLLYLLLCDIYKKKKINDSAYYFLKKAKYYASNTLMPLLYYELANYYYTVNKKDSAYYYLEKAYEKQINFLDTLKTTIVSEFANKIELLNLELNKKNLEIKYLKSEKLRKKIQERLILISVFIILIFLIVYLKLKNNYIKRMEVIRETYVKELIKYQENLNQRISMDLHDDVGQSLVLLSLNKIFQDNKYILDTINTLIKKIREISHNLYPTFLLNSSIIESINKLVYETEKNSNFIIIKEITEEINSLPPEKSLHVYRILQELISNTLKYCKGKLIYLKIFKLNEKYILIYRDVNTAEKHKKIIPGFGINSILLRTKILNGKAKFYFNKGFFIKIVF